MPFRDFFEHHMPGLYYLLAPVLRRYDVANSADAVIQAMFAGRSWMWAVAVAIVLLSTALGSLYGGRIVGWLSGALLSISVVFVARTLEIRPDVPALMFWTASQASLVFGLSTTQRDDGWRRRCWFGVSGLFLGGTLAFTQKALLAGPGFAAFSLLYVVSRDKRSTASARLLDLVTLIGGCALPLLMIVAQFSANGTVQSFVEQVFTKNLGWSQEVSPGFLVHWMLLRDPWLCALAGAGLSQATLDLVRKPRAFTAGAAMLLPTASLLAGVAFIPAPYPQYLLLVLPAAAVYGASFLWSILGDGFGSCRADRVRAALGVATFLAIAAVGLAVAQPFFRNWIVYPAFGVGSATAVIAMAWRKQPAQAAAVAVLAFSTYSVQQLTWMAGLSNADALAQIRYVHAATTPTDRVMDGFTGFGWFRPHAAVHWFLNPGTQSVLTANEQARVVDLIGDCRQGPTVVILDEYLRDLSPEVGPTVARYYAPTRYPLLWVRERTSALCREEAPGAGDFPATQSSKQGLSAGPRNR